MICIVRLGAESPNTKEVPTGWIIERDLDSARIYAESIGETEIAAALYKMFETEPGRYKLSENVWMLIG